MLLKLPHRNIYLVLLLILSFNSNAFADGWLDKITFGVGTGLGLTEIQKDVFIEDTVQNAKRSESPLTFQVMLEIDLSSKWTLGLRHSRGARLSPFSSGIGFTGIIGRRYFKSVRPYLTSSRQKDRVVFMDWAPFVGISSGFAVADTSRERDVVNIVSSSGFFMALHLGADYQMFSNFIFRPEIIYGTSLFDDTDQPATITQIGAFINLMFKL